MVHLAGFMCACVREVMWFVSLILHNITRLGFYTHCMCMMLPTAQWVCTAHTRSTCWHRPSWLHGYQPDILMLHVFTFLSCLVLQSLLIITNEVRTKPLWTISAYQFTWYISLEALPSICNVGFLIHHAWADFGCVQSNSLRGQPNRVGICCIEPDKYWLSSDEDWAFY